MSNASLPSLVAVLQNLSVTLLTELLYEIGKDAWVTLNEAPIASVRHHHDDDLLCCAAAVFLLSAACPSSPPLPLWSPIMTSSNFYFRFSVKVELFPHI